MSEQTDKEQVRALLDGLADDCSFADIQRAIAVLMWPKTGDGKLKAPERLAPDEVHPDDLVDRRAWLNGEGGGHVGIVRHGAGQQRPGPGPEVGATHLLGECGHAGQIALDPRLADECPAEPAGLPLEHSHFAKRGRWPGAGSSD